MKKTVSMFVVLTMVCCMFSTAVLGDTTDIQDVYCFKADGAYIKMYDIKNAVVKKTLDNGSGGTAVITNYPVDSASKPFACEEEMFDITTGKQFSQRFAGVDLSSGFTTYEFSADMRIPAGTPALGRQIQLRMASSEAVPSSGGIAYNGTYFFNIGTDGKTEVKIGTLNSAQGTVSDSYVYDAADFTPNSWHNVKFRFYYNGSKVYSGIYLDEQMLGYWEITPTADYYYPGNVYIGQLNLNDLLCTDSTYYKNVKISKSNYAVVKRKPTRETVYTIAAKTGSTSDLSVYKADKTVAVSSLSKTDAANLTIECQGDEISMAGASKVYFQKQATPLDNYTTLEYCMDMKIPEGEMPAAQTLMLRVGNATSASDTTLSAAGVNGTYYFTVGTDGKAAVKFGDMNKNHGGVIKRDVSEPVTFTKGGWNTVTFRISYDYANLRIYGGIYLGDTLLGYQELLMKAAYANPANSGIGQFNFNDSKSSQTVYYRNIEVSYTDNPVTTSAHIPAILHELNFNDGKTDVVVTDSSTATDIISPSLQRPINSIPLTHSKSTTYVGTTTYSFENKAGSTTDKVLNINASKPSDVSSIRLVQNYQSDQKLLVLDKGDLVLEMSYDIYIPGGTESNERRQWYSIGTDSSSKLKSDIQIESRIVNNNVVFYTSAGDTLEKKSVPVTVASDTWTTVKYIVYITQDSGSLYFTIHGVAGATGTAGTQGFEGKAAIAKNTGFVFTQQMLGVWLSSDDDAPAVTDTKYDNLFLKLWSDEDFNAAVTAANPYAAMVSDADYQFPIDISCSSNVVTARGRDADGNGTQKMIIAIYDSNKNIVAVYAPSAANVDAEKGIASFSKDVSSITNAAYAKAYMLDSLTGIVPLTQSSGYVSVTAE